MLVTKQRFDGSEKALRAEIVAKDVEIAALKRALSDFQRGSHDIANHMRYTLMRAVGLVSDEDGLAALAHALPYVLYGRQTWTSPVDPCIHADMLQFARAVASKYEVTLPDDPLQGGIALLDLAADLIASP